MSLYFGLVWVKVEDKYSRECLMYCLDNLSDERAMSLLYALGIRDDYDVISDNLSKTE